MPHQINANIEVDTAVYSLMNSPTSFAPPKLKESSLSAMKGFVRPAERFALLLPPLLSTPSDPIKVGKGYAIQLTNPLEITCT